MATQGVITLVSGWLGEAADFDPLLRALASEAGSPPAHIVHEVAGLGARYREEPQSVDHAAEDLLASTPRGSLLCAYSLGARVGLTAAVRAPQHFAEVIVCGVHPGLATEAERRVRLEVDEARARAFEENPHAFLAGWHAQELFTGLQMAPDFAALAKRRTALASDADRVRAAALVLRRLSLGTQRPLWSDLATVHHLQVIVGAEDHKFVAIAERMQAHAPRTLRVQLVAGAGHAILTQAPEQLALVLRACLARSSDRGD